MKRTHNFFRAKSFFFRLTNSCCRSKTIDEEKHNTKMQGRYDNITEKLNKISPVVVEKKDGVINRDQVIKELDRKAMRIGTTGSFSNETNSSKSSPSKKDYVELEIVPVIQPEAKPAVDSVTQAGIHVQPNTNENSINSRDYVNLRQDRSIQQTELSIVQLQTDLDPVKVELPIGQLQSALDKMKTKLSVDQFRTALDQVKVELPIGQLQSALDKMKTKFSVNQLQSALDQVHKNKFEKLSNENEDEDEDEGYDSGLDE